MRTMYLDSKPEMAYTTSYSSKIGLENSEVVTWNINDLIWQISFFELQMTKQEKLGHPEPLQPPAKFWGGG